MPLKRTTRLSLLGRMTVAFTILTLVSAVVVATAVLASGFTVWVVLLAIGGSLDLFVLDPLLGDSTLVPLLVGNAVPVVVVAGVALLPVLYLGPVREQVRSFRSDLRTAGTPASERHPAVADAAGKLAQQASIPVPEVRIANRRCPESYAVSDGDDGTVVLSRGLIRQLDDEQVRAVLAHEISHLANGDSSIMDLAVTPMLVAESVGSDEPPNWLQHGVLLVVVNIVHLVLWALLRLVTTVQYHGCRAGMAVFSRGREFAADRAAAQLTGSPSALAGALETLDDERGTPGQDARRAPETVSALDILPQSNRQTPLFQTHPRTEARIERLESLATEMQSTA